MDIFDRYFQMLRLFLPKDQRDDIVRELTEDIRVQVADRETGLGRPLSAGEQVAVIRQYGHPMLIAARYRSQGYLIGPVVFPYYWIALKIVLALVFVGYVVASVIALLPGAPPEAIESIVGDLAGTVLRVIGWTTVMAAVLDLWLTRSRVLETWDPTELLSSHRGPAVASGAGRTVRDGFIGGPVSIGHFVVGVIVSAWWLLGLKFPALFFGTTGSSVEFGPIVDLLYPVLVVTQVTALAEQFVRLAQPANIRFRQVARFVWFAGGCALLVILVTSREWQWFIRMGALGESTRLIELVNRSISVVVMLAVFGSAVSAVHKLWQRFSGRGAAAAESAW